MDSPSSGVVGYFPQLKKLPPHNHDGTGSVHVYVPWWKYDRTNKFLRGYHIEVYGGRNMPRVEMFNGMDGPLSFHLELALRLNSEREGTGVHPRGIIDGDGQCFSQYATPHLTR
jgi:hypothetical protein